MSQTGIELQELKSETMTLGSVQKAMVDAEVFDLGTSPTSALSRSVSPAQFAVNTAAIPKTRKQRNTEKIQLSALCWAMFLHGWNDGSTGPLLPRIREVYHVGFTVVSLLFVLACVGFVIGALLNVPLSEKIGFGKVLVLGATFQTIAYALQAPALPFPAFVSSFMINGFGRAMMDAQLNGYVASFNDNPEMKLGLLHATYGAGALVSPLVATQFAQFDHWSFHYLISLGIAISNFLVISAVFRLRTQDECLREIGQSARTHEDKSNTFLQILRHKHVHLLASFILVYVGTEVTIGGWIVTFLVEQRHAGPSAGYVSAGFFGGLMLGRVTLLWVNRTVGEHRVIYLYTLLAIGLELIVWLVPSLITNAVAVSIVGVLLGPIYPITINQASKVLPEWILTGSIGWIAGFGQAGSALFPFRTGALASKFGSQSLQPLLVAMMGCLGVLWALVPRRVTKVD